MKNLLQLLTLESLESLKEMKIDYPYSAELLIEDLESNHVVGGLKFDTLRTMITHFTVSKSFETGFDVYSFFKGE